jgi:uncharacterized membrane-anchored protein YjiN (DUF445 family)
MKKEIKSTTSEGSAYWNFQGGRIEGVEANPDMASNEHSWLTESELSENDEENLQAYQRVLSKGFVESLSSRLREVWKLAFCEWMRVEDISKQLGISKSAVKTYIYRAGDKIKKAILVERGLKMRQKPQHFLNGFKRRLKEIGVTPTDKAMKERLDKSKAEIDKFLTRHPYLKKEVD